MYECSPDQSQLYHHKLNSTLTKSLLISNWYKIDTEIWEDPFNSIWLKLLTVIVYAVEIMASIIMLAFVVYETNGLAGHYRTLINQLLSYHYGAVRVFPTGGSPHLRGFHYHGSHYRDFWLMYTQVGDFRVNRGPPTVPLTRILHNAVFSKPQNPRKAETSCILIFGQKI